MVLLHINNHTKNKKTKSLSVCSWISGKFIFFTPKQINCAKALQCACRPGSFTVEAALAVPVFLFAAVIILELFLALSVEIQMTAGLQYASRTAAISCQDAEDEQTKLPDMIKVRLLLQRYLKEHKSRTDLIRGGMAGISFAGTDFCGDYITLQISYRIKLPVSFGNISELPVQQCVRSRKWTGADTGKNSGDGDYVYVTPNGNAYHISVSCSYLDLSIRGASVSQVYALRNADGEIYDPCSCFHEGQSLVYITDYGEEYHGDLGCSGLKRTIYRIKKEEAGTRHPCKKCYGGT